MDIEFGLDTFGDITVGDDGTPLTAAQRSATSSSRPRWPTRWASTSSGVGEHHRREFAVSSPEMVLAAIASRTERLRLGTAVTVLSSDDPVRVYERFATLDALSNGRAEVVLGRGSFTESFPLFGYDLRDYDRLFEEKLELFVELLKEEPVSWQGTVRAPLEDADVFPKTEKGMRTWVGVGGSPESVVRVARHGLGLMLAIIGGPAARFRPFVDLYHRSVDAFGNPALPRGRALARTHRRHRRGGLVRRLPGFEAMRNTIGAERGWGTGYSRAQFQNEVGPEGAVYAGSPPDRVAAKIADTVRTLGIGRFDLKYATGTTPPHSALMRSIELYGTEVIPRVRRLLADD